ncbi:MAG: hypothetical protein ABI652_06795, partial [Acidobacteriota bacterium]
AELDVDRMRARASEGWVTLTELADTLAREHGLPFTLAHRIAAGVVRASLRSPAGELSTWLLEASRAEGHPLGLSTDQVVHILSPQRFVSLRRTLGGPAPDIARLALEASRAAVEGDRARALDLRAALDASQHARKDAVGRL